jgi:hypothetical protein
VRIIIAGVDPVVLDGFSVYRPKAPSMELILVINSMALVVQAQYPTAPSLGNVFVSMRAVHFTHRDDQAFRKSGLASNDRIIISSNQTV